MVKSMRCVLMKRGNYLNSRQFLFQKALLKSHPICLIDIGGNRHAVWKVVRVTNKYWEFYSLEQPADFNAVHCRYLGTGRFGWSVGYYVEFKHEIRLRWKKNTSHSIISFMSEGWIFFPLSKKLSILETSFQYFIIYTLFYVVLLNIVIYYDFESKSWSKISLCTQLSLYEIMSIDSTDNPPNEVFKDHIKMLIMWNKVTGILTLNYIVLLDVVKC